MKTITNFSFIEVGDIEFDLMTLKSIKVISEGQVIVYDKGVNNKVLSYINSNAERILLNSKESSQELLQIEKIIEDRIKKNKRIVRISRSDYCPLLEVDWKKRLGVSLNILPSLKPYMALPAENKISITRRGHNTSFLVIKDKIDVNRLNNLVVLLNKISLSIILLNNYDLLSHLRNSLKGINKETLSLAVIPAFSSPGNEWITGTVADISEKASSAFFIQEPIIIIGQVVETLKAPLEEAVFSE